VFSGFEIEPHHSHRHVIPIYPRPYHRQPPDEPAIMGVARNDCFFVPILLQMPFLYEIRLEFYYANRRPAAS